jgi:DUF4097 and DUF4098 domain-containing protein YvlB
MTAQTFNVGDRPRVEFKLQAGRIDCHPGPEGSITIEVEGSAADSVIVDQQGDTVVVREDRGGWFRIGSVRITAKVPPGTDVEEAGASTDLYVDGDVGTLVVKTASGAVHFKSATELEVKTASGDVRGGQVSGSARISSASGRAQLERVEGDLTAKLASGGVDVGSVGGDLLVHSASGDVRIERCLSDDIDLKSVSGTLRLGLPSGIRLDADFNTLSGAIHLPEGRTEAGGDERRRVRVTAKTVSGDIRIERIPERMA